MSDGPEGLSLAQFLEEMPVKVPNDPPEEGSDLVEEELDLKKEEQNLGGKVKLHLMSDPLKTGRRVIAGVFPFDI